MSPEQLTGDRVTPATDVFALGAVLTYAATGTGSAQSLTFRIAYEEPRLDALPGQGLEIVARCLAKDPTERPGLRGVGGRHGPAVGTERWRQGSLTGPGPWLRPSTWAGQRQAWPCAINAACGKLSTPPGPVNSAHNDSKWSLIAAMTTGF